MHNGRFSLKSFYKKSVFLFDLVLIQVHGQILNLLMVLIGYSLLVWTVTKFSLWHTKRKQNRQNNNSELKHAVVHHIEKNEYTME